MKKTVLALALAATALTVSAASPAEYMGGLSEMFKFIKENLRYPAEAAENGIEGRVLVQFTVRVDGTIVNPRIMRPIDPALEAEALRIVKIMPEWQPAIDDDGDPAEDTVTLPITFKL